MRKVLDQVVSLTIIGGGGPCEYPGGLYSIYNDKTLSHLPLAGPNAPYLRWSICRMRRFIIPLPCPIFLFRSPVILKAGVSPKKFTLTQFNSLYSLLGLGLPKPLVAKLHESVDFAATDKSVPVDHDVALECTLSAAGFYPMILQYHHPIKYSVFHNFHNSSEP